MTQTIAFAGKGGVGKTTVCGLFIQYLCRKKNGPVLAVDADANSNLNEVLGVDVGMTNDFDLLVMGRTQGKGCYCFVNGILTAEIERYAKNYRYIVVDNEAGLEHISRGVLPKVDTILLVSDCSRRGVQAAGRLAEMIRQMELGAKEVKLIINRAPNGELNDGVREEIERYGLTLAGVIPHDDAVYAFDAEGKPSVSIPEDSPVKTAARAIFDSLSL